MSFDPERHGVASSAANVALNYRAWSGQTVQLRKWRRKGKFDPRNAGRLLHPGHLYVSPQCPHYDRCGGCSQQHLEPRAQVALKQRVLEEALARIGKVEPESLLAPIYGSYWGYRHRARLSVRHVARRGVLVGFRERRGLHVVNMDSCDVLPPRISALIAPLRSLLSLLTLANRIPQIEVAVGEEVVALIFRVLDPPPANDLIALRDFGARYGVDIYLQPAGPETIHALLAPVTQSLSYRLTDFDLTMCFGPADFTQVNHGTNRMLVRRAVALLEPRAGTRVADMFSGLGNFTLALARSGAEVVGVEGSDVLVDRARENAHANGLDRSVSFLQANLFVQAATVLARLGAIDGMLIDPPRNGAQAVVKALKDDGPSRIVYVSCNPATLARDAGLLVHEKSYRLLSAGIVNMFPHTSHVESIALFVRGT